MDYAFQNFIVSLPEFFANFYNSQFMFFVKVFFGIYLIVIFIDIVLLIILHDVPEKIRVGLRGMDVPLVTKSKMQKRWDKIKERLKTKNVSQYKVAIIEADAVADEILGGIGYKGANMTEKLEQIEPAHIDDHLEALKGAHQIRNRIVHEENFEIDERLAKAVIGVYENFLKYLEYLK
ncbi:MAG TPA: hypothetical protein PLB52_03700 [Candidatus Moranbacteria bacterium]|nr:hypothetical protein [Candidatus Moranbacteria bacterium]